MNTLHFHAKLPCQKQIEQNKGTKQIEYEIQNRPITKAEF